MITVETDVLVIGGGGAGTRAALEAARNGAIVALAFKRTLGKSGCTAKAVSELSAYSAAFGHTDPRDKPLNHYLDTINEGSGLADEVLVKVLTIQAPLRLKELVSMGAKFNMNGNRFAQLLADASTLPRAVHCGADTGREVLNTVLKQIEKEPRINVYENISILKLLSSYGTVVGAIGVNTTTGEYVIFKSKSTVLATGGACQIFSLNAQPEDLTGDGYALAYDVGAELVNMEFIQFGPAIIYPVKGYLLVTKYWRLKPRLINGKGEEFLHKYVPKTLSPDEALRAKEFAFPFSVGHPGMYVDIAMHAEICEGRSSEHGGIYLDVSHNSPDVIENTVPVTFKWLLERGIDIRKGPIEIAPVAQCFIGGIMINSNAETNIPGLFCCGETEGGVHGAARPGGNMLAATQVFGAIAGASAAKRALPLTGVKIDDSDIKKAIDDFESKKLKSDGILPQDVYKEIQELMWTNVGIRREETGLQKTLNRLAEIESQVLPNLKGNTIKELTLKYELYNMVKVAKMVTLSAQLRKESRGTHFRVDYPSRNSDEWLKTIVIQGPGEVKVSFREPRKLKDFYASER